jgi:hypothetical protein
VSSELDCDPISDRGDAGRTGMHLSVPSRSFPISNGSVVADSCPSFSSLANPAGGGSCPYSSRNGACNRRHRLTTSRAHRASCGAQLCLRMHTRPMVAKRRPMVARRTAAVSRQQPLLSSTDRTLQPTWSNTRQTEQEFTSGFGNSEQETMKRSKPAFPWRLPPFL